jgi:hypothetical protein
MTVPVLRTIPNLTGETRVGDTITPVATGTKRSALFTLLEASRVVKLSLACDGAGGAPPTTFAEVRGVIYQDDVLLGFGDQIVVFAGDPLRWVDLPMADASYSGGVAVAAGAVEYAVLVSGEPDVLRVAQIEPDPLGVGGRWNANTWPQPDDPYGAATDLTANMSIFATSSPDWVVRPMPAEIAARLAWPEAQRLLASAVDDSAATLVTSATWHGTATDDNPGAFAIVRAGGPFAGLVGERLLITTTGNRARSCVVYVLKAVPALDGDLSLTRRAFASLDLLALDARDVFVQALL